MLAHYRYSIEHVTRELPCGQVFLLFDAMAEYVRLTNPYASSDEDTPAQKRIVDPSGNTLSRPAAEEPGAMAVMMARGLVNPVIPNRRRADLPADIQDLLT